LTQSPDNLNGMVALVGAGPGDPGLITVRGRFLLSQAQVVVYDALVAPVLLDHAPAEAELINAGKRAKAHRLTQDQINQLLVDKASQGLFVVRLKGGDPYLFGRGAEEVVFLAGHGIKCEVVPGVTAGVAGPAMAGVPVTHRRLASTVTFVTGHEDPSKEDSSIDYGALAALINAGGTVCFYMGVGRLTAISDELGRHGLVASTPCAVIQWGTTAKQRSVRTTLSEAQADITAKGVSSPAIIVVGPVAEINEPGLDFFTSRALFGQRIVITRTRRQVSDLGRLLDGLGAQTLEAPTIELVAAEDWSAVDEVIREISRFDWVVLTSTNGVNALAKRLAYLGLDARHLGVKGQVRIAAVGDATAKALRSQLGIVADLVPTEFVAESLAGELIARHDIEGKQILLLRADIARPALPRLLCEAGATLTELTAYRSQLVGGLPEAVLAALRQNEVDWVTFTSSSTATNMVELLGQERDLLNHVKLASIGPITTETLCKLGFTPRVEAATSNMAGLVDAMVREIV